MCGSNGFESLYIKLCKSETIVYGWMLDEVNGDFQKEAKPTLQLKPCVRGGVTKSGY